MAGDILTEDVVPSPKGPYGESKIAAENYILSKETQKEPPTPNKREEPPTPKGEEEKREKEEPPAPKGEEEKRERRIHDL